MNTRNLRRRVDGLARAEAPMPDGSAVLAELQALAAAGPLAADRVAQLVAEARASFGKPSDPLIAVLRKLSGSPDPGAFATADLYAGAVERWLLDPEIAPVSQAGRTTDVDGADTNADGG